MILFFKEEIRWVYWRKKSKGQSRKANLNKVQDTITCLLIYRKNERNGR